MPSERSKSSFSKPLKISFFVLFALAGVVLGVVYSYLQELPDIRGYVKPSLATHIYDINGELISQLWLEQRTIVSLDRIPKPLQDAVVAIEDERFYQHMGVDPVGILRAFLKNVLYGGVKEGASTITQQLARNLFLTRERTLSRKIREALLSFQIERNYAKKQILEMYLNQIYFGESAYGAESAARTYFGKHLEDLTLPECAMLAGLPRAPTNYDPYKAPLEALARRNLVLSSMANLGYITLQEATDARNTPIELKKIEMQNAPYFVEYVRQQLESRYGANAVYKGGLSVHTTLDLRLQASAQRALAKGVEATDALIRKYRLTNIPVDLPLQGALLAMDPHTGAIRAMIGGMDFRKSVFNRAIQAHRQPGSAFKPIIYAAAIENGYTMADVFLDAPVVYQDPATGKPWRPVNFSSKFRGPTTLHTALMFSINVVTIKLLEKLGIQPVVDLARRLGIRTPIKPNLSLVLGTSEITLEEMVEAFSVFDNQGVRVEPCGILTVKDSDGRILESGTPVVQEVLDPQTCYIMVNAMRDVIDRGTGRVIRRLGFNHPAAGKTGTTNDNVDAWFIGFTPDLACGVWVGYDERLSLGKRQTGGETAAPIWAEFIKAALAGKPAKEFAPPPGTESGFVKKRICQDSGELACFHCPRLQDEIFKKETAPTKLCPLHCGPNPTQPGGAASSGESGNPAPGGDILEMEFQPPVVPVSQASETPSTGVGAPVSTLSKPVTQEKKAGSDQQAYPDEGF